ncbi:hypothetical protein KCU85_g408, partial [Aureobasidium melanogenum]
MKTYFLLVLLFFFDSSCSHYPIFCAIPISVSLRTDNALRHQKASMWIMNGPRLLAPLLPSNVTSLTPFE